MSTNDQNVKPEQRRPEDVGAGGAAGRGQGQKRTARGQSDHGGRILIDCGQLLC